jgi:hypothetical protein
MEYNETIVWMIEDNQSFNKVLCQRSRHDFYWSSNFLDEKAMKFESKQTAESYLMDMKQYIDNDLKPMVYEHLFYY